ncbi:hypothetical protein [Nocardia sp. CY41]|uniref:hypothetical protein n=1 Tax=Nocardia sp. CY41 TaxID=2608686 RepID=UPI00135BABC0|nr:hypothetical protein [Nocardia sp. CY41]
MLLIGCARCGKTRIELIKKTPEGRSCAWCVHREQSRPNAPCGVCGRLRPVHARATAERPAVCQGCYRNVGDCVVCGRRRPGGKLRGGPFHCIRCWPLDRLCDLCGETKPAAARWPVGTVCHRCYDQRTNNPKPCTHCGVPSVLVAVADGGPVCGRCVGVEHLDFTCRGCGARGAIRSGGRCVRCVATSRLDELLRGEDSAVAAPLRPLADALRVANPGSLLTWLRVSQSCQLLTQLLAEKTDLTHEALDALPQGHASRHIREILVSAEILDRRNEDLAQLQIWAERIITALPASQQRLVRPFAEWHIIREARRTAARGVYREGAARRDRAQINTAIAFLNWLDTNHTPLGELTQHHVDAWFDTHRNKNRPVVAFLRWLSARRIIPDIEIAPSQQGSPQHFHDLDTHQQQLRRCLTDDTLPLEVRVAGSLIRLYGMPLAAIVELTTDRFTRDETGACLLFDTHPEVPPHCWRALSMVR